MADISATNDVTASIIRKVLTPTAGSNKGQIEVVAEVTIDPGTADAYPAGGVSLYSMFTASDSNDTGIDPTKPVYGMAGNLVSSLVTTLSGNVHFLDGAATALGKTVQMWSRESATETLGEIGLTEFAASNIVTQLGTTGTYTFMLHLWGTER